MPSADDIKHQQTLLATYRRTLGILLEQRAAHGAAYAPPAMVSGIIRRVGRLHGSRAYYATGASPRTMTRMTSRRVWPSNWRNLSVLARQHIFLMRQ